jgi:hypothetical protein
MSDVRFFCLLFSVLCLLHFAAGCENAGRKSLTEEVAGLRLETAQLKSQIEQSRTKNEQLKKQVQTLAGLPAEVRLECLYELQRIKVGGYTNFYDKDKDGQYEKLIVYIQPIDQQGDVIKAGGTVDVQLWDLNSPQANQALLGQWRVEPDELKKLWFATIMTINYRLTFDIAEEISEFKEPLTVKVTFTDYLSGKVFKEQKVIKPR